MYNINEQNRVLLKKGRSYLRTICPCICELLIVS